MTLHHDSSFENLKIFSETDIYYSSREKRRNSCPDLFERIMRKHSVKAPRDILLLGSAVSDSKSHLIGSKATVVVIE